MLPLPHRPPSSSSSPHPLFRHPLSLCRLLDPLPMTCPFSHRVAFLHLPSCCQVTALLSSSPGLGLDLTRPCCDPWTHADCWCGFAYREKGQSPSSLVAGQARGAMGTHTCPYVCWDSVVDKHHLIMPFFSPRATAWAPHSPCPQTHCTSTPRSPLLGGATQDFLRITHSDSHWPQFLWGSRL